MENKVQSPEQIMNAMKDVPAIIEQMNKLIEYFQHLEQGVVAVSQGLNSQALGLRMFTQILIDKKVCTEEEVEKYLNDFVTVPLKKQHEDLQQRIEEAKCGGGCSGCEETCEPEPEPEPEAEACCGECQSEDSPDCVLASEKSNVVRFSNEEQDD